VVLLLPHGYEGQGPDHSSARLERYLQLAAGHNWRVANCSTAAQYYHLLRNQAYLLQETPRPLIILTPKSLLRQPLAAARLNELAEGAFQPVLDDSQAREQPEQVERVVLCSGKIALDLLAQRERTAERSVAIVRLEQLYPLPSEALKAALGCYTRAEEIFWVQEEPLNMGAWSYIAPRLSALPDRQASVNVVARPERSSPATGFMDLYEAEQQQLIRRALSVGTRTPGEKQHVSS
jgi:2-oxoglutarate dehydrogenase E1 component